MNDTLSAARLSDLSAAISELVRGYGRRPTGATSWRLDEGCVITALEGFITPSERALAEGGAAQAVRHMRAAFGDAVADEYVTAAENGLGRRVLAHRSEVMCASGICLEIFLLADEPAPRGAPLLNAGWHQRPRLSIAATESP